MLNFRNTMIFFASLLALIILFNVWITLSIWVYAVIALVLFFILFWGSKTVSSGFYLKSLCHGDRQTKSIALTFDDGPDAQVTPMILDVLKQHNVKANFFVVGYKAQKHPELIKRIEKEGHIIGSHSWSHHLLFDLFSYRRMKNELIKTGDILFSLTGKKIMLFRPPYGVTNPPLAKAVNDMEYTTIGWSLKSNDTVVEDAAVIMNKLRRKLKNGDIVLFHDNKPWTVNVVLSFIEFAADNGYTITRLDKLLKIQVYVN